MTLAWSAEKKRAAYARDAAYREKRKAESRRYRRPRSEWPEAWKLTHRACRTAYRYTRAGASDGTATGAFIKVLMQETHCAYCCEPVPRGERQADHVWPLAHGGEHSAANLVMACAACNGAKRASLPLQWLLRACTSVDIGCLRPPYEPTGSDMGAAPEASNELVGSPMSGDVQCDGSSQMVPMRVFGTPFFLDV